MSSLIAEVKPMSRGEFAQTAMAPVNRGGGMQLAITSFSEAE